MCGKLHITNTVLLILRYLIQASSAEQIFTNFCEKFSTSDVLSIHISSIWLTRSFHSNSKFGRVLLDDNIYLFIVTDSAFKQQRLPAWQPILTAGTVLPTFFVIGIAFIPVGIGLLYFSEEVKEQVVDYTYCNQSILQTDGNYRDTGITCASIISKNSSDLCKCNIPFTLDVDFKVRINF